MRQEIDHHRRHFFGIAAGTLAAGLAVTSSANAQSGNAKLTEGRCPEARHQYSFGPLKQIKAGLLNVGYAEAGPINGPR